MSDSELPEMAPVPVPVDRPERPPRRRSDTQVPSDLIEGYEIGERLGEGSMGAVFRGRQVSLDRPVAIKVLTPRLAKSEAYLRRFQREARSVARLNHPNVVSGIDVGEADGFHYFVMEYVEGPTLQDLLDRGTRTDIVKVTKIVLGVAHALDHAHKHGLVHRDVKPGNIIVSKKTGRAKLCDLGLAKEVDESGSDTWEGKPVGTPYYISPEQAQGERDIDIRSDIYSLGATYFHAVSGQPPFEGPNPPVIMAKHLTEPAPSVQRVRPKAPLGCAKVIEKMLQKKRGDRYQNPKELIEDLELVARGEWKDEGPKIRRRRRRARRRFR